MSSKVNSLKKKLRHLQEIPSKWKELSETYQKIGIVLKDSRQFSDSLGYFRDDQNLCSKHGDVMGQALGKFLIPLYLHHQSNSGIFSLLLQQPG